MLDKKIFYVEAQDLHGLKELPAKCAELAKRKKRKKKEVPPVLKSDCIQMAKGVGGDKGQRIYLIDLDGKAQAPLRCRGGDGKGALKYKRLMPSWVKPSVKVIHLLQLRVAISSPNK